MLSSRQKWMQLCQGRYHLMAEARDPFWHGLFFQISCFERWNFISNERFWLRGVYKLGPSVLAKNFIGHDLKAMLFILKLEKQH